MYVAGPGVRAMKGPPHHHTHISDTQYIRKVTLQYKSLLMWVPFHYTAYTYGEHATEYRVFVHRNMVYARFLMKLLFEVFFVK
jgi:hypothetical protein